MDIYGHYSLAISAITPSLLVSKAIEFGEKNWS